MLSSSRATLTTSFVLRADRLRRLSWIALIGTLLYGAVAPLLAIVHELIVLGTAHLIGDVSWYVATGGLLQYLPLDPIYTSAMLLTLGGIEPRGLAVASPLGELLHERWPLIFQAPAMLAPGAWASAVVAPGSTIVSRWLCGIVADAALVTLGLLAIWQARAGRRWLLVAGAIVHAHVVVAHLIDAPPPLSEVEAAGIPFAIAMIVSGDVEAGPRLSETLEAMSAPLRDAVLGLGMVVLAYLPVLAVLALLWLVRAGRQARQRSGRWLPVSFTGQPGRGVSRRSWAARSGRGLVRVFSLHPVRLGKMLAVSVLALAVAVSPLGDLADARTRFLAASVEDEEHPHDVVADAAPPLSAQATASAPLPARASATDASAAPPAQPGTTPSVVAVTGAGYRYRYTVNGVPQVIRGIGYNVRYRRLPPEERVRRLDRDFAELRRAGVNTVFGWEPTEFDTVLLDAAHRHGLGVAPPFELDPEAAYNDPAVRAQITRDVLAWVELHRDHPALRMWAIGNEVLHKLVYPSWMPMRSDPAWEQRARDFSAFYVELIDRVHAADPNHPIVHRDAEDAYLTWLRDAMQAAGGVPAQPGARRRPWFIYGVNSYTPRLAEILTSWPRQGWDVPLFVSEYAPGGLSPADRPQGLRDMWKMIRGANGWVLGGSVYAWTTDGPEEVDRVFGLMDGEGRPVDEGFAAISAIYRGAARQGTPERTTPGDMRDNRVWDFARYVVGAIQEGRSRDLLPATADTSIMGDVSSVAQSPPLDAELLVQRVRDPRRVAWSQEAGVVAEWWVSWLPPSTPHHKLMFIVQEHKDRSLGVQYIYYGPR